MGEFYMKKWGCLQSACQTLREIYALTDDPTIRLKCRIATRQCKMMASEISRWDPRWERRLWPWREPQPGDPELWENARDDAQDEPPEGCVKDRDVP